MLKNLSTSSFNRLPYAFLVAILIICSVEYVLESKLDGLLSNHEVDTLLHDLNSKKYHADYLLIGDSVGRQLSMQYSQDSRFAMLATNQAIEITGQYFLIKRYMEENPPPRAVIFTSQPFIEFKNLNQVYTENFVLRTFDKFSEISEVFKAKYDVTYLSKMITYKALFSYKYRLRLQEKIIGYTNANIYTGTEQNSSSAKYNYKVSLIKIIKNYKESLNANSSELHFRDLVDFLYSNGVDFYYIPVPIEKQAKKSYKMKQHNDLFKGLFPSIKQSYSNTTFYDEYIEYPRNMFADHTHYNKVGLLPAKSYMSNKVDAIVGLYENQ